MLLTAQAMLSISWGMTIRVCIGKNFGNGHNIVAERIYPLTRIGQMDKILFLIITVVGLVGDTNTRK